MKIRTKIILPLSIAVLVVTASTGLFLFRESSKNLENNIYSHLEVDVGTREDHIRTYLYEYESVLELLASEDSIANSLKIENDDFLHSEALAAAKKRIETITQIHKDFFQIHVLDKNGKVIASSCKECEGEDCSKMVGFNEAKKGSFTSDIHFDDKNEYTIICVSAPILDGDEVLGVLAAKIKTEELFQFLKTVSTEDATKEIYLINKEHLMISPSLFVKDAILNQKVETENSINCFEAEKHLDASGGAGAYSGVVKHVGHEAVGVFKNYLGVNVLGAHVYIPEMHWCLLAEVSEREAMSRVRNLMFLFILGGFISIILVILIIFLVSKKITDPIDFLRKGTEIIEKGNFDYKVGIKSKDEIGKLSRSFDKMTLAMKESKKDIERKVEEQTKEISEKAKKLEIQRKSVLNVLRDVEKEKLSVEKEKDKIDAILHSIGDAVFVVDNELKITMYNQVAEDISGYTKWEVIGKKYDEILKFVYGKDAKVNDKFIKEAMKTGEIQETKSDTYLIRKNGTNVAVANSAAPLKDKKGSIIGCVIVFRNVAKERQIDQAKTEFVSLASHQLRSPLSSINWYTEMLLAGDAGKVNEEQKEFLEEIYHGNQRMVGLVNALLNVSRLELGTFTIEPEPSDLSEIMESVLNELKNKIEERKIKVIKYYDKELKKINVDPKLTHIVFQNFLSNAVKYNKDKGTLSVKIEKLDKNVMIQISDNGMGIPKEQQKEVFSKLFRADNVKEADTEGTGLGLYIVKSILDNSGCEVWFESQEGKGTTFSITIPLSGMQKKEGLKKLS